MKILKTISFLTGLTTMKSAWKYSSLTIVVGDLPVRHFIIPLSARLSLTENNLNIGLWYLHQNITQPYALLKVKKITSILFALPVKPDLKLIKSVQQSGCIIGV